MIRGNQFNKIQIDHRGAINKETENWNNRFFFSFSLKVVGAPPKKLKKRRKIKIRSSKEGRDLQRIDLELASCWDQVQILHLNSHPDARWGKAACPWKDLHEAPQVAVAKWNLALYTDYRWILNWRAMRKTKCSLVHDYSVLFGLHDGVPDSYLRARKA